MHRRWITGEPRASASRRHSVTFDRLTYTRILSLGVRQITLVIIGLPFANHGLSCPVKTSFLIRATRGRYSKGENIDTTVWIVIRFECLGECQRCPIDTPAKCLLYQVICTVSQCNHRCSSSQSIQRSSSHQCQANHVGRKRPITTQQSFYTRCNRYRNL